MVAVKEAQKSHLPQNVYYITLKWVIHVDLLLNSRFEKITKKEHKFLNFQNFSNNFRGFSICFSNFKLSLMAPNQNMGHTIIWCNSGLSFINIETCTYILWQKNRFRAVEFLISILLISNCKDTQEMFVFHHLQSFCAAIQSDCFWDTAIISVFVWIKTFKGLFVVRSFLTSGWYRYRWFWIFLGIHFA